MVSPKHNLKIGEFKILKKEPETTNLISILDTDINVKEIISEIESRLKTRNIDQAEILRLSKLDSTPSSPSEREFDPAHTAFLFDKGISPPKFTNPALRYVRGPFRWIAIKLVEIYALLEKKLSENRIKAFYSVVHELILQRAKMKNLESRLEELTKDYTLLKSEIVQKNFTKLHNSNRPFDSRMNSIQKNIIKRIPSGSSVLLIESQDDFLFQELQNQNCKYRLVVYSETDYTRFKQDSTNKLELIKSLKDLKELSSFSHIIFENNASLYPPLFLDRLLYELAEIFAKDTKFLFFYSNHSQKQFTPFQEVYPTFIFNESLTVKLKELGFSNIVSETITSNGYTIISFEKK